MSMTLKGTNGIITADDKKVVISRKSLGGLSFQGIKGDRTIYYKDVSSIEYKRPTKLANGYIQFIPYGTIATDQSVGILGTKRLATKDPNSVFLRAFKKSFGDECDAFRDYVMDKLENYK
ncbi:hypothetical protein CBG04_07775 [Limosilactobacillus reuteri]|uniref:DUF4429 domain-containing protein n=1 Tax=Limosilactobacillus reuteri TaxID=1598 RepID=UPI000B98A9CC|nr:DUF4429 domain-containing protein [Limosilactobacillus reuteri]OYS78974.1 hypothetical protein CBG11_10435 [Limosilactobacillus reuteri]OYS82680.1 hypothetical protein CBG04_07775 [Limosilactobacillus reuteri]OYS84326.1 hypothetical protein CBG14_05560 [Limosilactobacillus reuteri]